MRLVLALFFVAVAIAATLFFASRGFGSASPNRPLRTGDIVFQTSKSAQSDAIQLATHSTFTHVGIVAHEGGKLVVYEALGTVHTTPIEAWIARSPETFVAKRLKNSNVVFDSPTRTKLVEVGKRHLGKPYDAAFDWSDSKMYCSEVVWKIYHEIGVDLGIPRALREFDLTSPVVKTALEQRYGKKVPLDAPMISPQQIFDSDALETVQDARSRP
jgi:hypothetical protein